MVEEHDVAHDARLDELEKAGLEATQKLFLEIYEKYDQKTSEPSQNDQFNILQRALEAINIKPESIIKAVLLQKLLAATDCDPEDLAKIVGIENALLGNEAPPSIVTRIIMEALEKSY